jgi:hypothetical protein
VSDIGGQAVQVDGQDRRIEWLETLAGHGDDHTDKDIAATADRKAWVSSRVSVLPGSVGDQGLVGFQDDNHAGLTSKIDCGLRLPIWVGSRDAREPGPLAWVGCQDPGGLVAVLPVLGIGKGI